MQEILSQSATTLTQSISNKQISATELTSACLDQIEKVNPSLNAVVVLKADSALEQAKRLDELTSKGESAGPLHGIPFTLKDVYNTKGDIVTAGCLGLKDNVATDDATIVTRLKQAGAILLGKTNTPELENAADTDNLVYGKTSNPYDNSRSSGGSSGGGAAIVSACGSVFDIGADTGGSLRIPAHYCGISTTRPTIHRIPSSGVVYGLRTGIGGAITTEGPLCRHSEDLKLILSILQGVDGIDPNTIPAPLYNPSDIKIKNLQIAYFDENGIATASTETKSAIKNACQILHDGGAAISDSQPKAIHEGFQIFQEIIGANASHALKNALETMNVTEASSLLLQLITHFEPFACKLPEFMARWDKWEFYRSQVLQFFDNHDALICPVTPDAALPHDNPMWNPNMIKYASYSWSISSTLLPVTVVRAGTSKDGLPIGVQIVTKPFCEHVGIAIAQHIEATTGGWVMPDSCRG